MKKAALFLLILLPAVVSAQNENDCYGIYSKFLQHIKWFCHGKADFVVRESTDYGRRQEAYIAGTSGELRAWYRHGPSSVFYMPVYDSLMYQIKYDTAWVSLLDQLNKKIKQKFIIKNLFSPCLDVTMISSGTYHKIFKNRGSQMSEWARFHKLFPGPAYLIDLSQIVSDGKRAVFYFARRWDGIGNTGIVFFKWVGGEWRYLGDVNVINY